MSHRPSTDDRAFARAFETLQLGADDFDHRAHLRLAWVYLCSHPPALAAERMRGALLAFLDHLGVGSAKYHETLTQAWTDAVAHFMRRGEGCTSFSAFIERNSVLLDTDVMLSHYAPERLFSDRARERYLTPDRQPIPEGRAEARQ